MINFKEYLVESRGAPLYHATTYQSAERILKLNKLVATEQNSGQLQGKDVVFFTRSKRHAMNFIGGRYSVVFVVNQQKLRQRYKVSPLKNHINQRNQNHSPMYMKKGSMGGNEFEEIVTKTITNFEDYIDQIMVNREPDKNSELYGHPRLNIIKNWY